MWLRVAAVLTVGVACLGALGCQSGASPNKWLHSMVESWQPPTPSEAARDAFNTYDPDKRRHAVALLSASPFGDEDPYLRTYRLLIDDKDATVRAAAAQALGMHGTVEDAKRLVPLLRDDMAFVRWEAAKALQRIHNPIAVEPLMATVSSDEDADARMAAARRWGNIRSRVCSTCCSGR